MKKFEPIHPGEILLDEFLKPLNITQYALARDIGVSLSRINEIVHRERGITADTALRLARYFRMEAGFWMNLQCRFSLKRQSELFGDRLDKEVKQRPVLEILN